MNAKFVISNFVFCTIFLFRKSDLADVVNSSISSEDSPLLTECTLTSGEEAFCVLIYDCLNLLKILNTTSLRARICGPMKARRKRPQVCCEKYLVKKPLDFAFEQKTITSKAPQALFQSCGFQQISSRIIGGDPSDQGEFPWLARILNKDRQGDTNFACSGSLISSRIILTSAHCLTLHPSRGEVYAVSLGEHRIECDPNENNCSLNKQIFIISETIIHPRYDPKERNHDHDIGLIVLRDVVTFTEFISPICLLETATETNEYYISGWGMTEQGTISSIKLRTTLPPFSWTQCVEKYKSLQVNLTHRQICAGGVKGQDSCQGDSGGPLMIVRNATKWFVAGVVSFGVGCGKQGWPGIYIYVPSYIDWIRSNVERIHAA